MSGYPELCATVIRAIVPSPRIWIARRRHPAPSIDQSRAAAGANAAAPARPDGQDIRRGPPPAPLPPLRAAADGIAAPAGRDAIGSAGFSGNASTAGAGRANSSRASSVGRWSGGSRLATCRSSGSGAGCTCRSGSGCGCGSDGCAGGVSLGLSAGSPTSSDASRPRGGLGGGAAGASACSAGCGGGGGGCSRTSCTGISVGTSTGATLHRTRKSSGSRCSASDSSRPATSRAFGFRLARTAPAPIA